jgi:hypothetical protein
VAFDHTPRRPQARRAEEEVGRGGTKVVADAQHGFRVEREERERDDCPRAPHEPPRRERDEHEACGAEHHHWNADGERRRRDGRENRLVQVALQRAHVREREQHRI